MGNAKWETLGKLVTAVGVIENQRGSDRQPVAISQKYMKPTETGTPVGFYESF